jgi:hypothetical protein
MKPLLKRIHDLRPADFQTHPVWINVHGEQDQPWHAETDEVTYRPWTDPLPFDCSDPIHTVLVTTLFRLADGTQLPGFITAPYAPRPDGWSLSHTQPDIFTPSGELFRLYSGASPPSAARKARQYLLLSRVAEQVFPIDYAVPPGLLNIEVRGVIDGFNWLYANATPHAMRAER